ncbi:FtsK/SpoIIIE domain-containing protein [Brachybacterium tyrofermentans]|uniref:FtsK/SpoIIIE domain-containing protein n=1 Tax=Brachybacterium tyrofermentans TaxID=47848 RepID=A0ABW0FKB0_9MICO|nr:FtsK/SpoIIIE domain-containing protein [Brachybacterium tyrofermentans]
MITGAPQSGRTTLLRTIGASLALSSTPAEVAIYGLDLSGSGLRRLEAFPHVGGVATRGDETRITRLIEEREVY